MLLHTDSVRDNYVLQRAIVLGVYYIYHVGSDGPTAEILLQ